MKQVLCDIKTELHDINVNTLSLIRVEIAKAIMSQENYHGSFENAWIEAKMYLPL